MTTTTTTPAPIRIRNVDTSEALKIDFTAWLDMLANGSADPWYVIETEEN